MAALVGFGDAVVHPSALFAGVDEAGLFEDGEVFGDGGGCEAEEADDLADAEFAGAERKESPDAAFIRERFGDFHEVWVGHAGLRLDRYFAR